MPKVLLVFILILFSSLPLFAQEVDTAWVRTTDFGVGGRPNDIAIDDSGNVYVTGYCFCGGGFYSEDYATVKYYPNGDTAWIRTYGGPGNNTDTATAIALDRSGNVYVTGWSYGGSGTKDDYATIKYYPNGDTAWVRRYNGSANLWDGANDIAVDDSGNVYVTGDVRSVGMVTIKYYANGDTAWVRSYGAAYGSAIVVDDSGYVYVTGPGGGYVTIKYYPNGDTAWVRKYNGPVNSGSPNALTVDGSGNVYVTGVSPGSSSEYGDYATVKYGANGNQLWVARYSRTLEDIAYAIAVNGSGNVYVTGSILQDYATIKYDPNGNELWERRYNGPGQYINIAYALALDVSGNVYVTGRSDAPQYNTDWATIKYHPNGDTAWVKRFNGPDNGFDLAKAMTVDSSGSIYVTGITNYGYYTTIKYVQDYRPIVTAPDSSALLCGPDTIRFHVTATDSDPGDTITLTGPGISSPLRGPSPVSADIKFYITSGGTYNYIYKATDRLGFTDYDTATWVVSMNSRPDSFSLLSPSNHASVARTVTFKWGNTTDPNPGDQVRYDLFISTSSNFHPDSTVVHDSLLINQFTDTLGLETYYWKVRAYDHCLSETFSNQTWTFQTVSFLRGDANGDTKINVTDVIYIINYLFKGGDAPIPIESADVNCDGKVNVADVIYLINYLFKGGPPPAC